MKGRWEAEEGEGGLTPAQVESRASYSRSGLSPAFERCRLFLLAEPGEWTMHRSMKYYVRVVIVTA